MDILCGFLLSLLTVSKLPFELRPVCCCLLVAGITDAGHYNCLKIYYFMAKSVFHHKKRICGKMRTSILASCSLPSSLLVFSHDR